MRRSFFSLYSKEMNDRMLLFLWGSMRQVVRIRQNEMKVVFFYNLFFIISSFLYTVNVAYVNSVHIIFFHLQGRVYSWYEISTRRGEFCFALLRIVDQKSLEMKFVSEAVNLYFFKWTKLQKNHKKYKIFISSFLFRHISVCLIPP